MSESVISKDTAVRVKAQTIDRPRLHNRTLREFTQALPHTWSLGSQCVPFVLVANNPWRKHSAGERAGLAVG